MALPLALPLPAPSAALPVPLGVAVAQPEGEPVGLGDWLGDAEPAAAEPVTVAEPDSVAESLGVPEPDAVGEALALPPEGDCEAVADCEAEAVPSALSCGPRLGVLCAAGEGVAA